MEPLAPTSGISGASLPKSREFSQPRPIPIGVSVVSSSNDVSLPLKTYVQLLFLDERVHTSPER
jgi:hypothetical protein